MINRNNYEIYALDYLEGTLSDSLRQEFECFLEQNPDIREEILSLMVQTIPQETAHSFAFKHKLKKSSINGLTYIEELIISDIEGLLSSEQKKKLSQIIENDSDAAREYNIYTRTKLYAPNICFPDKDKLKKKIISLPTAIGNALAYAAIIIMLISIFSLIKRPDKQILTSLQLTPQIEQIIILSPADLASMPFISRPIVANKNKEEKNKPHYTNNKKRIITSNIDTNRNLILPFPEHIESKKFYLNYQITHNFKLKTKTQVGTMYNILAKASVKAQKHMNSWIKHRGIQISKQKFLIKINDKTYGISVAGK